MSEEFNKLTVRGVFFYIFGTFWTLEFLSFSNKYITAQATPPFVEASYVKGLLFEAKC